jgi:2-polyprenyl-3-methyl-5-hydroxy-6-metoxy-1,4-benzoquinol methylase
VNPEQETLKQAPKETSIETQRSFWNDWNSTHREQVVGPVSQRQAEVIQQWMTELGRTNLDIIDIGCGTGWLCEQLTRFGRVTGTDLANEVIERARLRVPAARFIAGDFMALDIKAASFDVVTTLEVLSHMQDQPAFIAKLAASLRPGGTLMMATQNRFVLERNDVPPPKPGQLRRWVNRRELVGLLTPHFDIERIFSVTPVGNRGVLRLANSIKLNRLASALFGADRVRSGKENLGLGWTLMARAYRR